MGLRSAFVERLVCSRVPLLWIAELLLELLLAAQHAASDDLDRSRTRGIAEDIGFE